MSIEVYLVALCVGRVILGLAPIVAARASSRLLGFPEAHDNATARLMARLFGVRDIGLGVIVAVNLGDAPALRKALWLNLAMDMGDALMIAVPLLRKQGIDRAARLSLAAALGGGTAWVIALQLTR